MSDPKEIGKLKNKAVQKANLDTALHFFDDIDKKRELNSIISQKVQIPMDKVNTAIAFWKPLYFSVVTEGRLLNAAEAYDLGDEKVHGIKANKVPYIAMCNLMALEAMKIMGDTWPTVEDPDDMLYGTEREREVAKFWKATFAPSAFQTQWAWSGVMSVMAGNPTATQEFLDNYKEQLP